MNTKEISDDKAAAADGFKLVAAFGQDCDSQGVGMFQDRFDFLPNQIRLTNVMAAEWPNEQNNDLHDPGWGQQIYGLAHPRGIPVHGPSFGLGTEPAQMGDQSAKSGFWRSARLFGGLSPTPQFVQGEMQAAGVSANKPIVATECGNYPMPNGVQG